MENLNQQKIKPTKNLIRPVDSQSSWSITDKEIIPSPEGADLNLQRFKMGHHEVSEVSQTLDSLNEEELIDLQEDILETIEEYMNDSIQKMSNPTFHEDMLEEITDLYHDYWIDSKICEEENYEIVEEIIELMESQEKELKNINNQLTNEKKVIEKIHDNTNDIYNYIDKIDTIQKFTFFLVWLTYCYSKH